MWWRRPGQKRDSTRIESPAPSPALPRSTRGGGKRGGSGGGFMWGRGLRRMGRWGESKDRAEDGSAQQGAESLA
jgi:hypothetical protein